MKGFVSTVYTREVENGFFSILYISYKSEFWKGWNFREDCTDFI